MTNMAAIGCIDVGFRWIIHSLSCTRFTAGRKINIRYVDTFWISVRYKNFTLIFESCIF